MGWHGRSLQPGLAVGVERQDLDGHVRLGYNVGQLPELISHHGSTAYGFDAGHLGSGSSSRAHLPGFQHHDRGSPRDLTRLPRVCRRGSGGCLSTRATTDTEQQPVGDSAEHTQSLGTFHDQVDLRIPANLVDRSLTEKVGVKEGVPSIAPGEGLASTQEVRSFGG